jgi:hypothetical protein
MHWSEMEATVEIQSSGKSEQAGINQAATYALFLLQARPDLTCVPGIFLTRNRKLVLLLASPDAVYHTEVLSPLTKEAHYPIVYAFIHRMYCPLDLSWDHTVTRVPPSAATGARYTFNLAISKNTSQTRRPRALLTTTGWRLLTTISSPYEGTHVYVQDDPHASPLYIGEEGCKVMVIKEKVINTLRRYKEHDVLKHIHEHGAFPSIVQLVMFEKLRPQSLGGLQKFRFGLSERGTPYMDLMSPLEVCLATYDLLEGKYFLRIL